MYHVETEKRVAGRWITRRRSTCWGLGGLLPVFLVVMGQGGCPGQDEDGDGWTTGDGDCNDADPLIHPEALEVCDRVDNDCDGAVDEDLGAVFASPDVDGDGFGGGTPQSFDCATVPTGYAVRTGDCNDSDATIHPGAADPANNGVDEDCGGTVNSDPHVGLTTSPFTSIQAALDAAAAGATVWVGPGTYLEHDITFGGKAVTLASTDGSAATVIDARSQGPVLYFAGEETPDTVVRGFTLTGGRGFFGGGVYAAASSPTLSNCVIKGNEAVAECTSDYGLVCSGGQGGGLFVVDSSLVLDDCTVAENRAQARCVGKMQSGGLEVVCAGGDGAGMFVTTSSPSISGCTFTGNEGFGDGSISSNVPLNTVPDGGAIFVEHSAFTILRSSFKANVVHEVCVSSLGSAPCAQGYGGAIALLSADLTMEGCTLLQNVASDGGAIALQDTSSAQLLECALEDNTASNNGGAVAVGGSSAASLIGCEVTGNNAVASGGGVFVDEPTSLTLFQCTLSGNSAEWGGGVALSTDTTGSISYSIFSGNSADFGGGLHEVMGDVDVSHCTFAENTATDQGGGIYSWYGSLELSHTILAYNVGYEVYDGSSSTVRAVPQYCDFYTLYGPSHNLLTMPEGNLEAEPRFLTFLSNGTFAGDDLHLRPDSPLIDAGDPAVQDPDGSRADIGAYGGPEADWSGYVDADQDGMYDAWELEFGLDPTRKDGAGDLDKDGLSNSVEFTTGTNPQAADSDGDGYTDGQEVQVARDPLNPCSQPGATGMAPVLVPDDFSSIQEAIDAIPQEGVVTVAAGSYAENLVIRLKHLRLEGEGGSSAVVLDGGRQGSVVSAQQAELEMEGFTVRNGEASDGGGLNFLYVTGALTDVSVTGNRATGSRGGGGYLQYSTPTLTDCDFSGNTAGFLGGGLALFQSDAALLHCDFTNNTAGNSGGGLYLDESNPLMSYCTIVGNQSEEGGGGVYLDMSEPEMEHCLIADNEATDGGGLNIHQADPTMRNCTITSNTASESGGGIYGWGADGLLEHCTISNNTALEGGGVHFYSSSTVAMNYCEIRGNTATSSGGGMYVSSTSPRMTHCIISGNTASRDGGGIYAIASSGISLRNGVVAYNRGYNVFASSASPSLTYCDVYNPTGYGGNYTGVTLGTGCLTSEPMFLSYDGTGYPLDLHLRSTSPLVNAGDPSGSDPDSSRADIGIYGGSAGDDWDRDGDTVSDYFWPGSLQNAPTGFFPADYDCDDLDPAVQTCL